MKKSNRFGTALHSRTGAYLFFSLAVFAVALFTAARGEWSWFPEVPLYRGAHFVQIVFAILGVTALIHLIHIFVADDKREKGAVRFFHTAFIVLSLMLFGWTLVVFLNNPKGNSWELVPTFPLMALTLGLPLVLALQDALPKAVRTILAVLLCVAVALPSLLTLVPADKAQPFGLSAEPLVLDIGNDNYSVVFATNRNSTAELTYQDDDVVMTLQDAAHGRMNVGRVHHFIVPRENFNGSDYRFFVREVITSVNGNTEFGAVLQSRDYHFLGDYKDDPNILIASDWHDHPDNLLLAAANFPKPDLFLMMGDYASNYNTEDEFILNTIAAGANVTKSEVPAIYVRGNHELYGEMTAQIFENLGLESFFYQVQRGKLLVTVLDGADSWGERSAEANVTGSVNTDHQTYYEEQFAWLEALPVPPADTVHFAAAHVPDIDAAKPEQKTRFYNDLKKLNVDAQFSGDEHALHLDQPGTGAYKPPYPLLVDGGPKDGSYGGTYVCSMAQVTANSKVQLTAFDSTNEKLLDKILDIR
ncbi:MAG: metallophosphoesterase [Oscillospiraceae bacterium]|jgi:predicted MPP superfamily phosphohydrolase|nr:metallophosphoesterase [Oscillospiraceae bacterium]